MNNEKPRSYTANEIRQKYLELVWSYINYWETLPNKTDKERLEGLAFSMLVILDGGSEPLPGFVVAPIPHVGDKEFHESRGENWFPQNHETSVSCDIAGRLHSLFLGIRPKEEGSV